MRLNLNEAFLSRPLQRCRDGGLAEASKTKLRVGREERGPVGTTIIANGIDIERRADLEIGLRVQEIIRNGIAAYVEIVFVAIAGW